MNIILFNRTLKNSTGIYQHSIEIISEGKIKVENINNGITCIHNSMYKEKKSPLEEGLFITKIYYEYYRQNGYPSMDEVELIENKANHFDFKNQIKRIYIRSGYYLGITKKEQDTDEKLDNMYELLAEIYTTVKKEGGNLSSNIQNDHTKNYDSLENKLKDTNDLFLKFLDLYHSKNKEINQYETSSIIQNLSSLAYYLGDFAQPVRSLSEKIKPKKDLIAEALEKARDGDMIGSLEKLISGFNTTQEHSISLEEVQKIFSSIICDIWKQKEDEKSEVRDLISKICKEIDLEIFVPTINSSYDFRESKIVKTVPKNATQANKAVISVITPCIKVKSTSKILEKANVEVAE